MRIRNRDCFSLKTPCDPMAVLGTLRANTCAAPLSGGCFLGKIPYGGAREFTLWPACSGRNSWLPELHCTLEPEGTGAVLHVTARCGWFTRLFTVVWYVLLTPALFGMLLSLPMGKFRWEFLWGLGVGAWGFILPHVCFWRPMNRAKRELCRILQGQIA